MARASYSVRPLVDALRVALTITLAATAGLGVTACAVESGTVTNYNVPEDIGAALEQLPRIDGVEVAVDGIPFFVSGDLGRAERVADLAAAQLSLAPALSQIAPVFRLRADELGATSISADDLGMTHVKYLQTKGGLEVIGGELILHVGADGVLKSVTSSARGNAALSTTATLAADAGRSRAAVLTPVVGAIADPARLVFVISSADGKMHLAWESRVTGVAADGLPVDDLVYVDAHTGELADRHPQIHTAKSRNVYTANGGQSLPGSLVRSEGSAAGSDTVVNAAYDNTGGTYDCYKELFNRDSFNNAGAQMRSTVHYGNNYVNAFWNGSQMVFGDGDGSQSAPLAKSFDVTAHELTHAVTSYEANLVYQNEPGALNEGMSDIFAAVCEARRDGAISANTWKVGEEVWTPGTAGDALRYMNDPIADGQSKDYYPTRYTGTGDNGGVHLNSGIANLAFKLAVTGGTHPRGKTSINVPAIGMAKAGQIFYRALTQYMTTNTSFAGARTATGQAAQELYGATEKYAIDAAWYAVGVGTQPTPPDGGGDPPPPPPPSGTTNLTSGVPVTGVSGAVGSARFFKIDVPAGATSLSIQTSGGSGDADVYVKLGAQPSTTSFDKKSESSTTTESVVFTPPATGSYYILVSGYAAFSGMQIVATVQTGGGGGGGNVLTNGVPVSGLSGATGATVTYTFAVPAGKASAQFKISGGTGDADIYVRFGAAPTTSTYDYRPYLNGNAETVNVTNPQAGTWYVMVRGYSAYSGLTLQASHP